METQTNRIPCLDGLRAISIAFVIISHLSIGSDYEIYSIGNLGVRVFFVISGFLITSILTDELTKTSTISLTKFYFRRTLRIFPAYYFFIFVALLFTLFGFYNIPFLTFLIPITYTSNYLTPLPWEIGHTWSLSVEEQFYLLFPSLLLVLTKARTKKLLVFTVILIPFVRLFHLLAFGDSAIPFWFTFSFHTNIDALATGCYFALSKNTLLKSKHFNEFSRSSLSFFVLIASVLIIGFNTSSFTYFYNFIGLTILNISIAFCIFWLIANHQSWIGKMLNSKPFVFVGTLSYSLYLWQEPFTKYSENQIWTHYPYNILLIVLFSLFSYYVVERNFLKLRENMEKNIFPFLHGCFLVVRVFFPSISNLDTTKKHYD
jgi:peptidoglycan/LPS O-acetylase OafA/YrhL